MLAEIIAKELQLTVRQVGNTIELLEGGATVPFIARYRKEATGSLDEVAIGNIKSLHEKYTELQRRGADGCLMLDYILCQLTGAFFDICSHIYHSHSLVSNVYVLRTDLMILILCEE